MSCWIDLVIIPPINLTFCRVTTSKALLILNVFTSEEFRGQIGDSCRRCSPIGLQWWMMLPHVKRSVKMQPLLESQQKLLRKDNMCSFLPGFPYCCRRLCSPRPSRATLYTPDKSAQAEKKHRGTKALYVMLSSCIDFFSRISDRQHQIVASRHVKLGLGDRIGSAGINQLFGASVGLDVVERRATVCD